MMGAMSKSPLRNLLRKSSEAFSGVVLFSTSRAETVSWFEGLGHIEGQVTDWQEAGGLMARLRVGGLSAQGAMLFRVELFNHASSLWRGGISLTDQMATDSEAVLTIQPSGRAVWWSYLSPNACQVFVRIDPDARSHF